MVVSPAGGGGARGKRIYPWAPQVRVTWGRLLCTGEGYVGCPCLDRRVVVHARGLVPLLGETVSVTVVTVGADRHAGMWDDGTCASCGAKARP